MAVLSFDHVNKIYPGGFQAVRDFQLEIAEHECVVLTGPSGCGKSTVLRMVSGQEPVTSGTVKLSGRVINDMDPKDRDVAIVFQNSGIYRHMTVYDNMAFELKLRRVTEEKIDRMVKEAARILNLEHLLERKPGALSGGQVQRMLLGRAVVRRPKVFLMDEPLANLDEKLRIQMRLDLAHLHETLGTAMLCVAGNPEEAQVADARVVVMKEGEIQRV